MSHRDPLILLCNQITTKNHLQISQKLQNYQPTDYIRVLHNLCCEEPTYAPVVQKTIAAIPNTCLETKYEILQNRIIEMINCGLDKSDTEWILPWIRLGIIPKVENEDSIDTELRERRVKKFWIGNLKFLCFLYKSRVIESFDLFFETLKNSVERNEDTRSWVLPEGLQQILMLCGKDIYDRERALCDQMCSVLDDSARFVYGDHRLQMLISMVLDLQRTGFVRRRRDRTRSRSRQT